MSEDYFYMAHVLRLMAMLHSLVSLAMLIAYYHLKVPLAIFKREKEIARRLEFDGLYIAEQPEDDDIKSHWDKLVISAKYARTRTHTPLEETLYLLIKILLISGRFRSTIGINLLRKKSDRNTAKLTISIRSVIY